MVYDISENKSTTMARSKELFVSCKASNRLKDELTESQFRRNVDLAWMITTEFAAKHPEQKTSEPKVIEPVMTSDHPPCQDCGGIFFLRTGTCHVCQTCGESQGCS